MLRRTAITSQSHNPAVASRRRFLAAAMAAPFAATIGGVAIADDAAVNADDFDFGPFKMGVQSWTLREYDFETALRHAADFGLGYVEFTTRHVPVSNVPSYVEGIKKQIADAGLKPSAMGVVTFDENENKARELFEFAKAMGLLSISANPKKSEKTFELLEKLVDEFEIPIAIHNHGPKSNFDKSAEVVEWTDGRHPLIGACVDCGHYLRSDEKPEEIIATLGERVFGVHLKDARTVSDSAEFAALMKSLPKNRAKRLKAENKVMEIVGEGELNLPAVFRSLQQVGYERPISLEYEENPENPLSDIAVCLTNVTNAIAEVTG